MARKVDLKAVKAAKQKKIAIGGAVLFIGLLAFSVPKTLAMLHGPAHHYKHKHRQSTLTAAGTTPTTSTGAVPVVAVPTGPAVLTAQLAPAAREGQLEALSASFKSKDPFRQLIDEDAATSTTPLDTSTKPEEPAKTLKVVPTGTPAAASPSPAPAATPDARKIVLPFLSAVISVNGVREGVDVKVDFPADAPVFHLVTVAKRTVEISVAGGSLAGGKATLTLNRGKPLTLVNTADGTRYKLVLVSTSTAAAVKPTDATSTATQPSTTPQTTTAPTTTTPTIGG